VSSEHIVHVTDASFEQDVLKAGQPVLVDFWAEWCGPCKMIAPMLDEVAGDYKDRLLIAKINIDENPKTPQRFNVRGIPTLILFKNGQVEGQKVGALRKPDLAAFLDNKLMDGKQ
jgi:thioredoxin 1